MQYFNEFWQCNSDNYDAVLFDVDGTLISGSQRLNGSLELLEELSRTNKPYLLLTNDADNSLPEKSEILRRCGIDVPAEKIISAASPLSEWAEKNGMVGEKFFLMGEMGNPCYAINAGLKVTKDSSELDSCAGVLVGEDEYNWRWVMTEVFNFFLRNPQGKYLISPSPDICWAGGHCGGLGLGAGAVAEALQLWLKHQHVYVEPLFLGKPYRAIYDYALERLGMSKSPERVIMLGDSLRSDIAGAKRCGIASVLLLSGITTPEMLNHAKSEELADFCFQGLAK